MNGPVCSAFDKLRREVIEELASSREENFSENGLTHQQDLSPLIHPDCTDPDQRRAVLIGIVCPAEADIEVETVGPFPMTVEDPVGGGRLTLRSEGELTEHFRNLYGEMFATVRPMPFAEPPMEEAGE